jgi:hypothetical protein
VIRALSGERAARDAVFLTGMRRMSQPAKAQEPSMEEILASIRRIIADDDATKPPAKPAPKAAELAPANPAAAPPPAAPAPAAAARDDIDAMLEELDEPAAQAAPAPPEDVLELTEAMAAPAPEPAPANFRRIEPDQDVVFDDPPPPAPAPLARPPQADTALLSNAASAAVHSAFGTLAHSVLVQNTRTLEDLVKEMLRPMLKAWLDDNLPVMVERLVRAEIERVSRGPRA